MPKLKSKGAVKKRFRITKKGQAVCSRFKQARGFRGGRSKLWRTVSETLVRSWAFATADRRRKKRDFRRLWIVRISAATRMRDLPYSQFIDGLNKAGVQLDRKQLAELAIHDDKAFAELVGVARSALGNG
jgi:large subunit ribosomal protein L20